MRTRPCCLETYLKIVPATLSDYHQMAHFHYCGDSPGPVRKLYKIIDDHVRRRLCAPVVGIIVYGAPSANLAARNRATARLFCGLDRSAGLTLLNKNMLCIRRVIIEPRYRGLGLATRLVKETLPAVDVPMVEALSVMGRVHPFFERAGMQPHTPGPDAKTERLTAAMETVGIVPDTPHQAQRVHAAIDALSAGRKQFIESEISRFAQKFTSQRNRPHSLERTEFVLSRLSAAPMYYLWRNPAKTLSGINDPPAMPKLIELCST